MKKNDSGFAKNVANFQTMLSRVAGFGNGYDPANADLKLGALKTQLTNMQAAQTDYNTAEAIVKKAVDDRITTFKPIKQYGTRIYNGFKACVTDDNEAVKTLGAVNRKLQGGGKRKKDPKPLGNDNFKQPQSNSQQSFTYKLEHLSKMLEIVSQYPAYQPNETDIQITGIEATVKKIAKATERVDDANTDIDNARKKRNLIHFQPEKGTHAIAAAVKSYVKSTYGARSAEYKQISTLRFLPPRKN